MAYRPLPENVFMHNLARDYADMDREQQQYDAVAQALRGEIQEQFNLEKELAKAAGSAAGVRGDKAAPQTKLSDIQPLSDAAFQHAQSKANAARAKAEFEQMEADREHEIDVTREDRLSNQLMQNIREYEDIPEEMRRGDIASQIGLRKSQAWRNRNYFPQPPGGFNFKFEFQALSKSLSAAVSEYNKIQEKIKTLTSSGHGFTPDVKQDRAAATLLKQQIENLKASLASQSGFSQEQINMMFPTAEKVIKGSAKVPTSVSGGGTLPPSGGVTSGATTPQSEVQRLLDIHKGKGKP